MIKISEDYCYFITKNKIELLLLQEIVDEENIYFIDEKSKYKCSYLDKQIMYYNSQKYYKYIFSLPINIDITNRNKVSFDKMKLDVDYSQYYKTREFRNEYHHILQDLGVTYNSKYSLFKVWTPLAKKVRLLLFDDEVTEEYMCYDLELDGKGIWRVEVPGDLKGKCYLFELDILGKTVKTIDIYARSTGVNGEKGVIIPLKETDPEGFRNKTFKRVSYITDAIIYETHIKDFTINEFSGVNNKGKYLGFTETDTINSFGDKTCLEHLKDLGVNYVQFLPFFDFASDEINENNNEYTFGYDPENFNAPEGSYSTDPFDPKTRIIEIKMMIKTLHDNGIGVLMDIDFTHTYETENSSYQKLVPNYYYRTDNFGNITDGSNCNNELATERDRVRNHFIDSIVFWAKEYNIDGFRFNGMKLHDCDTMNIIRRELDKIDVKIIMYGEGVAPNPTPLKPEMQTTTDNAKLLSNRIAFLSKISYDGIRGNREIDNSVGFINGSIDSIEKVKFTIVGSVPHRGVKLDEISFNTSFWAKAPTQNVTYSSYHNDFTLWDKLVKTNKTATKEELINFNKMAIFIMCISQGGLLLQAGEDFARNKKGEKYFYNFQNNTNEIDWNLKSEFKDLYRYYKALIKMRKNELGFRLRNMEDINSNIQFLVTEEKYLVVKIKSLKPEYDYYIAIINGNSNHKFYTLDKNYAYHKLIDKNDVYIELGETLKKSVEIKPYECILLVKPKTSKSEFSLKNLNYLEKDELIERLKNEIKK